VFTFGVTILFTLGGYVTSQRKVSALCVRALVIRRRCTLSALARALPASCHVRYRLKRLARFMDNPRLKLLPAWDALAQRAAQLHPQGWRPMLLDETGLRDHAMVLSAAVPTRDVLCR